MLKVAPHKFIALGILSYFLVEQGQSVFEFGSEIRKDFYFTGMAFVKLVFAYSFYLLHKSIIIKFWLFFCMGSLINELFFHGSLYYIEITISSVALIYNLAKR